MSGSSSTTQSTALRQIAIDAPKFSGYEPLDADRREIRLFDISEGLCCQLRHESLNDKPPYAALSYYWGPPGPTRPITVDAEVVQIRKTLYQFLKSLLRLYGPLTVWLDVLCINQRNTAEQNSQVAMMGDIYSHARCVYSWLGKAEPDMEYAMNYLCCNVDEDRAAYDRKIVAVGMEQMLLRRYWTRVWIIQECLLNKIVVVLCGNMAIDLDFLLHTFQNQDQGQTEWSFFERPIDPSSVEDGPMNHLGRRVTEGLRPIIDGRSYHKEGGKKTLLELVHDFAEYEC